MSVWRRAAWGSVGLVTLACVIGLVYFVAASPRDYSNTNPPTNDVSMAGLSCGPAALLAVTREHDAQAASRLGAILHRDGRATSPVSSFYDLAILAKQVGFDAVGLKIDAGHLPLLPIPAIVHVKPNHFLTLVEVTDERVTVVDQGIARREIPRRDFDRRFSGYVLCFRQFLKRRG